MIGSAIGSTRDDQGRNRRPADHKSVLRLIVWEDRRDASLSVSNDHVNDRPPSRLPVGFTFNPQILVRIGKLVILQS